MYKITQHMWYPVMKYLNTDWDPSWGRGLGEDSARRDWNESHVVKVTPQRSLKRRQQSEVRSLANVFSLTNSFSSLTTSFKMSFAGRRSRNKVKKGVQFTLMVVGMFKWLVWLGSKALNILPQVHLVPDVQPLLIPSASRKSLRIRTSTLLRQLMSKKVSELSPSALVSETSGARVYFLTCIPFRARRGWCSYRSHNRWHPWIWR